MPKEQDDWHGEVDAEFYPGIWIRLKKTIHTTLDGRKVLMVQPITYHRPIPDSISCKSCGSTNLYRHGSVKGIQRYRCRDCGATFYATDTRPRMRMTVSMVGNAIASFYGGMSVDNVGRTLGSIYGVQVNGSNVYRWVVRFTKVAVKAVEGLTPKVGNVWVADETVLKIAGENQWFWDCVDDATRFLLASHISAQRYTRDAQALMEKAMEVAGKPPDVVLTDKLRAYLDGIERAFGSDTVHIQSGPFSKEDSTRAIERFHGSLKDRTKVMRGMQNRETAKLITQGWLIHYNYLRPHEGLRNRTPAEVAGVAPLFKSWPDVVRLEGRG